MYRTTRKKREGRKERGNERGRELLGSGYGICYLWDYSKEICTRTTVARTLCGLSGSSVHCKGTSCTNLPQDTEST